MNHISYHISPMYISEYQVILVYNISFNISRNTFGFILLFCLKIIFKSVLVLFFNVIFGLELFLNALGLKNLILSFFPVIFLPKREFYIFLPAWIYIFYIKYENLFFIFLFYFKIKHLDASDYKSVNSDYILYEVNSLKLGVLQLF